MSLAFLISMLFPIAVIVFILASAIRILREYERGVVFTLGRCTGVKGPGLILVIPVVQQVVQQGLVVGGELVHGWSATGEFRRRYRCG